MLQLSSRFRTSNAVRAWVLAAVALVIAAHLPTIHLSPVVWRDEVQIVDYGRVFLEPGTPWFMTSGHVRLFGYLGPLGQELGYRLAGNSMLGPRVLSLVGGGAAALAMFAWLSMRTALIPAALVSLAFLLDPLFTGNYRSGRVDMWAFTCGLWACALFRSTTREEGGARPWRFFGGGFLAGVLPFIWPSAVLLYPLLAAEAVPAIRQQQRRAGGPSALRVWLVPAAGWGLAVGLALMPSVGSLSEGVERFVSGSASDLGFHAAFFGRFPAHARAFAVVLILSPWLLPLGAAGLLLRRERGMAAALALVLGFIALTHLYEARYLYVLPYLVAGFADLVLVLSERGTPPKARIFRNVSVAVTIAWGAGVSLGARPALALSQQVSRSPDRLAAVARESSIPEGASVYIGAWEMYYAGRGAGWQLYKVHPSKAERCEEPAFVSLLAKMDFAIFDSRAVTDALQRCLTGVNFTQGRTFRHERAGTGLRVFGRQLHAEPYGSYVIFAKNE